MYDDEIWNALYMRVFIALILYKKGSELKKLEPRPVKVGFRYIEVSNLLLFFFIFMS